MTSDPSGRDPTSVNMTVVKQGYEPLSFTGWFPTWSNEKWRQGKSFEELKKELGGNFDGINSVAEVRWCETVKPGSHIDTKIVQWSHDTRFFSRVIIVQL